MADTSYSQMEPVEELRIARHQQFCIAIPFPRLDWSSPQAARKSLDELHDYALQMGNSGLDWYLRKKKVKKGFAKALHWSIYAVGIAAAIFPLLKLSNVLNITLFTSCCGSATNFNSFAAEMSLALIGVAAGLALIDKSAGISNDWMRYIKAATQINRALVEFNFDWDRLEQTLPYPPRDPIVQQAAGAAPESPKDPIAARIDLVREFCLKIVQVMAEETSDWADDLKERVSQMDRQLPRAGKG